jgi:hypothetical protein
VTIFSFQLIPSARRVPWSSSRCSTTRSLQGDRIRGIDLSLALSSYPHSFYLADKFVCCPCFSASLDILISLMYWPIYSLLISFTLLPVDAVHSLPASPIHRSLSLRKRHLRAKQRSDPADASDGSTGQGTKQPPPKILPELISS